MSIAIIGAGASGLVTAHKMQQAGLNVTVLEQTLAVGGVWRYSDARSENDIATAGIEDGFRMTKPAVHALYPTLKTNLPADLMAFRDWKFPDDIEMFPSHTVVQEYLESYYLHFAIPVRFQCRVISAKKLDQWQLEIESPDGVTVESFDYLVVCNGHYSQARIPDYAGMDLFRGKIMHSQDYRGPVKYKGERVLVIGSSYSGLDIARECSQFCQVFVSTRNQKPVNLDPSLNVTRVDEIVRFTEDGGVTASGEEYRLDRIIFATGYLYHYPFLNKGVTNGFRVHDLLLDLIWKQDPTLAFVGLPKTVVPFHLAEYQAEYLAAVYTNKIKLDTSNEIMKNQHPKRREDEHSFGYPFEFEYCDYLAGFYNGPAVPKWRHDLRSSIVALREQNIVYSVIKDNE
ncbi:hypothetical protein EDD86DRAFT_1623 [Gorgonomyces haynaldii]|nr:hypothetical protein EDD86DRAFT_1623 [Gorgonomyces haynaldii]